MYKGQLYEIIMFREVGVKAFLPAQVFVAIIVIS